MRNFRKALMSIGFASVSLWIGEAAIAVPVRKCPFESRTIQQVVEESKTKSADLKISQATPMEPMTTTSPDVAVEQVRAIYKQICSRTSQVPSQPQTVPAPVTPEVQPIEQPPAAQPIEQPAPVRALW